MSTTATPTLNRQHQDITRDTSSDAPASNDIRRIRREYLEMPGLGLTLPQAGRLWGLSLRRSERLLSVLVDSGFLVCDKTSAYRRRRQALRASAQPLTQDRPEPTAPLVEGIAANEPRDVVDEAAHDSFPASDPPGWTLGVERKEPFAC